MCCDFAQLEDEKGQTEEDESRVVLCPPIGEDQCREDDAGLLPVLFGLIGCDAPLRRQIARFW